jgi:hypothetical protein
MENYQIIIKLTYVLEESARDSKPHKIAGKDNIHMSKRQTALYIMAETSYFDTQMTWTWNLHIFHFMWHHKSLPEKEDSYSHWIYNIMTAPTLRYVHDS